MPRRKSVGLPCPGRTRRLAGWLVLALLLLGAGIALRTLRSRPPAAATPPAAPPQPPPPPFAHLVLPTDQQNLLDLTPGAFQPTASGNPESALYGSVRTARNGHALVPSFHEGIDIAPTRRDRHGQPLDNVYAVAAGTVAYVNRHAGNSNYGRYVVLLHPDPLGEVYSLYAHLADITPHLKTGAAVAAGTVLGRMGHTPTRTIPPARAHLHFEVGLINNTRFDEWFRHRRLTPDHGRYNGWNLLAINPLDFLRRQSANPTLTMRDHLAAVPRAFELVLAVPRQLDFFQRYPGLWQGPAYEGRGMAIACAENGVPLEGRNATAAEAARLGTSKAAVLQVDEAALGRNGARLVVCDRGRWRLGRNGERWLEILTYPQ